LFLTPFCRKTLVYETDVWGRMTPSATTGAAGRPDTTTRSPPSHDVARQAEAFRHPDVVSAGSEPGVRSVRQQKSEVAHDVATMERNTHVDARQKPDHHPFNHTPSGGEKVWEFVATVGSPQRHGLHGDGVEAPVDVDDLAGGQGEPVAE
jgi:hypothetical protein